MPPPRPMAYEMWSPTSAPAAATRITAGRYGAPEAANTPAVITAVSLGTTGKKPSSTAIAKIARYTQGEDIVSCSRSSRSMIPMLVGAAAPDIGQWSVGGTDLGSGRPGLCIGVIPHLTPVRRCRGGPTRRLSQARCVASNAVALRRVVASTPRRCSPSWSPQQCGLSPRDR